MNKTPNEDIKIKEGKLAEITPADFGVLVVKEDERRERKYYQSLSDQEKAAYDQEEAEAEKKLNQLNEEDKEAAANILRLIYETEYANALEEGKQLYKLLELLTDEDIKHISEGSKAKAKKLKSLAKNKDARFFEQITAHELFSLLWTHSQELPANQLPKVAEVSTNTINHEIGAKVREKDLFELLVLSNDHEKTKSYISSLNKESRSSASLERKEEIITEENGQQAYWEQLIITIERFTDWKEKHGTRELKHEKKHREQFTMPVFTSKPQLVTLIESEAIHAIREGKSSIFITDKRLRDLGIFEDKASKKTGKKTGKSLQLARTALQQIAEPLSRIGIKIKEIQDGKTIFELNENGVFSTLYVDSKEWAQDLGLEAGRGLLIDVSRLRNYLKPEKTFIMPTAFYALDDNPFIIAKLCLIQLRNNPHKKENYVKIAHVLRNIGAGDISTLKKSRNISRQCGAIENYLKEINEKAAAAGIGLVCEIDRTENNKKPSNEEMLTNGRIKITMHPETAAKYHIKSEKPPRRKAKKAKPAEATPAEAPAGEWISQAEAPEPEIIIDFDD